MENQEAAQAAALTVDRPAGFWVRGGAVVIDTVVIYFIVSATAAVLRTTGLFATLIQFAVGLIYYTLMVGTWGQTVGKMAAGAKIVRVDGSKVGYPRALGRHFAAILSGLLLCLGYILAAFTNQKRALHDYVAGTRVVYPEEVATGRKALMASLAVLLIMSPVPLAVLAIKSPFFASLLSVPATLNPLTTNSSPWRSCRAKARPRGAWAPCAPRYPSIMATPTAPIRPIRAASFRLPRERPRRA